MINVAKEIFKIFSKFLFSRIINLSLFKRIKYIIAPIQVDIEVAIGIIIKPYFLNKETLIKIFIIIINKEI